MLTLMSPHFEHAGRIPSVYTADGSNISPPLMWNDAPVGTRSFALVVEDPDGPIPSLPQRPIVHWIVYNLPADLSLLPQDAVGGSGLPGPAEIGINDWQHRTYDGPEPLLGRHRYIFKLYALDTMLASKPRQKSELEKAIRGHVLDEAGLVGIYEHIG
jgi:Raf kinase inhibitor-like YbhB/YbcL family protein